MIANAMQVETWTRGKKCTFSLTTADLENANDIEDLSVNLNIVDIPDHNSPCNAKTIFCAAVKTANSFFVEKTPNAKDGRLT